MKERFDRDIPDTSEESAYQKAAFCATCSPKQQTVMQKERRRQLAKNCTAPTCAKQAAAAAQRRKWCLKKHLYGVPKMASITKAPSKNQLPQGLGHVSRRNSRLRRSCVRGLKETEDLLSISGATLWTTQTTLKRSICKGSRLQNSIS